MLIYCKLATLILVLTLNSQVHSGNLNEGHEVVPHSRPYMGILQRHMQDGRTNYCGCFLISEDFVMTAAHCQAKSYTVLLGVHNVNNKNEIQEISVEKAFPHHDYSATDYRNDIMLLKLSSKAHISEKVRPITLADHDDDPLPKSCTISGWGRTDITKSHMSPVLMEVKVNLIDDVRCANNYFCSMDETGPAEGDGGGPLFCEDGKAYGVISSIFIQHSENAKIHRYTKIPNQRKVIDQIMKPKVCIICTT